MRWVLGMDIQVEVVWERYRKGTGVTKRGVGGGVSGVGSVPKREGEEGRVRLVVISVIEISLESLKLKLSRNYTNLNQIIFNPNITWILNQTKFIPTSL